MPTSERSAFSSSICAHIRASIVWVQSDLVLTYVPVGSEVDVLPLAVAAIDAGKRAGIPRTESDVLSFDEVDSEALASLVPGAFAIPVPAMPRTIVPTSRTLLLVPLLAFDASGRRLGSGRGFYDRYLKTFPGTSVGVAFAVQEVEAVPVEAHDVALGVVVTEAGWRSAVSIGPN